MDNISGVLRIKIKRGVRLAVRDVKTSDPYVVVRLDKQKLKTRVVEKDVNPVWNQDLSLTIHDPELPIKLTVYDHDSFSRDDKMGDAEFDIKPYLEALKMHRKNHPSGTILKKIQPARSNCLAEESHVIWKDGKIIQNLYLRLRNVECGEVELELNGFDAPGGTGSSA